MWSLRQRFKKRVELTTDDFVRLSRPVFFESRIHKRSFWIMLLMGLGVMGPRYWALVSTRLVLLDWLLVTEGAVWDRALHCRWWLSEASHAVNITAELFKSREWAGCTSKRSCYIPSWDFRASQPLMRRHSTLINYDCCRLILSSTFVQCAPIG